MKVSFISIFSQLWFFFQFLHPVSKGITLSQSRCNDIHDKMFDDLVYFDIHWAKKDSYLFGEEISFADLVMFFQIQQAGKHFQTFSRVALKFLLIERWNTIFLLWRIVDIYLNYIPVFFTTDLTNKFSDLFKLK